MEKYGEIQTDDILVLENNDITILRECYPPDDHYLKFIGKPIECLKARGQHIKSIWRFTDGKPKKVWSGKKDLNEAEKAVIALAKSYGCKWIAKTDYGEIVGFYGKPYKAPRNREYPHLGGFWIDNNHGDEHLMTPIQGKNIHFTSWEDDEPYYIGDKVEGSEG